MKSFRRMALSFPVIMLLAVCTHVLSAQPKSAGAVVAWHVTLAPSWFDPAETPPQITPFGLLYAIH
ncbi:MAG TPA: hypothetical protein VHN13_12725, partial [Candidatus Tectomicrobia bacterium]|nr:hypothetical protein [Candidatus Tectomicrobia bacterium]